jgi:hypothetical protein
MLYLSTELLAKKKSHSHAYTRAIREIAPIEEDRLETSADASAWLL